MINRWVTILLGPILLLQAVWVRRRTPVLPEPPGERSGSRGDGPYLKLAVIGDSAAAARITTSGLNCLKGDFRRECNPRSQ